MQQTEDLSMEIIVNCCYNYQILQAKILPFVFKPGACWPKAHDWFRDHSPKGCVCVCVCAHACVIPEGMNN